jgi:hypothetical protein
VVMAGSGAYELLATIQLNLRGERPMLHITGLLTIAALTSFKISGAAGVGGTHVDLLVDGDFDTATQRCPEATTGIATLAAPNNFRLWLNCAGLHEIKIYGKSAGAAHVGFEVGN